MNETSSGRLVLTAARGLLWLALAGAVVAAVVELSSIVWGMLTGTHFQAYVVDVVFDSSSLSSPTAAVDGASVRGIGSPLEGSVSVDFGSGWSTWLALHGVEVATGAATVAVIAWLLLRIIGSVDGGEPLSDDNASRVSWIGLLLVGVAVLHLALDVAFDLVTPTVVTGGSLEDALFVLDLPLLPIAGGLVITVLGQVWRRAAEIRAEHDLTV